MSEWEHIAPEDPPGFLFDEGERGYPYTVVAPVGDQSAWVEHDSPEQARAWAWACLGGRKRYAELIAPGLVREAATRHIEEQTVVLMAMDVFGRFEFEVTDGGFCSFAQGKGPDICTAALATIQALGGGE